jgi:hypothetical protein
MGQEEMLSRFKAFEREIYEDLRASMPGRGFRLEKVETVPCFQWRSFSWDWLYKAMTIEAVARWKALAVKDVWERSDFDKCPVLVGCVLSWADGVTQTSEVWMREGENYESAVRL